MMLGKKEQKFQEGLKEHLDAVEACLISAKDATNDFFEGGGTEKCYEVGKLESRADEIRRSVEEQLFEGAFFPNLRGDFFNLIETVDAVAKPAEHVADILAFVKPDVPEKYRKGILDIHTSTIETFGVLREAILSLNDTDKASSLVKKIRSQEHQIDEIRRDLIKTLFTSRDHLDSRIIIRDLILQSSKISNVIEDVSDIIYIMIIKMRG